MGKGRARQRAAEDKLSPAELRQVRQRAMQALYAMEATGRTYDELSFEGLDGPDPSIPAPAGDVPEGASSAAEQGQAGDTQRQAMMAQMARRLAEGAAGHREEIDAILAQYAQRWKVDRLPKVDLAILRLGLYELTWCKDIPPGATINECVELAKEYSTAKSGAFINGILGNYHRRLQGEPGGPAEPDEPPPSCSE